MTQMIMINYDFISDNLPNQCHQRSILTSTLFPKRCQNIRIQHKNESFHVVQGVPVLIQYDVSSRN